MGRQAKLSGEIAVTAANKVGVLADMSRLLSEAGINIEAAAGYAAGNEAKIMIVTADNAAAVGALKNAGYASLKENEVVIVDLENKPGALKEITLTLASSGVDIKQLYGTACSSGCPSRLVFSTSDNQKALEALKR
ncbi:MAG: ACT domain-containing protein [Candidatus Omnitrophota bacterium]